MKGIVHMKDRGECPVSGSDSRATVAAVVVNFNSGDYLRACLRGLSEQSYPLTKIIVIDNCSTDNSLERLEDGFDGEIVKLGQNVGFAKGNNLAAEQAEGCEWLAFVNPDAVPEPRWLEKLLEAAAAQPNCVFVGGCLLQAGNTKRLDGAGDMYHVSGAHWRRGWGQLSTGRYAVVEEVFSPCAAAAICRKDVFLKVGGFDESFFCYAEDIDLGFRMRLLGFNCFYVPDAIAYHVGSATTGCRSDFTVYHGHRNLVWTYFKNMPWPLFWLYLPQHILLNLISLAWFSLRGQARVIFKAKWDALKGLPRILRERKKVQSKRRVSAWELRRVMVKNLFRPYFTHRMQGKS
jgi:GT2 family glycosyltransferase